MANIKISELTALTPPDAADLVPVTDSSASQTKRTTVGEIVGIINGDVDVADDGTATISELPVSKLQDGAPRQLLQTDAAGTGVEWTDDVDIPGTLDVTGATTLDSTLGVTGQSTLASAAVSDLTSGRVVLAGTSGELEDNAGLTFNGTQLDVDGNVDIASAKEYRIAGTKVLDATSLGSAVVSSSLTSVGTIGTGTWQGTAIDDTYLATISTAGKVSNSATTADSANTASAIVARDASGDFSAGAITAALIGNADTATALSSNRTFAVTGDITGTVSSDLTSGASIATSIASGVIVDADVNASAAIAGTKINPDFGSQNVTTTGTVTGASLNPTSSTVPTNGIYLPAANSVAISSNGTQRVKFDTSEVVFNDGGVNYDFRIEGDTNANLLFVDASTDKVGVGSSSLNTLFHVNGSARLASEGLGGGTARNGIIAETSGTQTRLRWQHFDNTTSPYFAVDPATDSTKLLIGTNGSDKVVLDASGRVGIGVASPSYQLQLSTDSAGKPSSNTWTIVSDERIKEEIELADLNLCYEAVKNIPLKRFKWKDEVYTEDQVYDRRKLGWIAQDVEAVFPKAVRQHEFKYNQVFEEVIVPAVPAELDENGNVITEEQPERIEKGELISEEVIEDCRNLDSDQLYAAMYGAIQKLISKVETLEAEIAALKA